MTSTEPVTELDPRFSDPTATATSWARARDGLAAAPLYWLSTVRPDGRPHTTPLIAVWLEGALHFCTGADERKNRNLEGNPHCTLTTGSNELDAGLDLVVEGDAVRVRDEGRLRRIAEAYVAKYGEDWRFSVRDNAFHHGDGGTALVYEVTPRTAFGFAKGTYGQTRWRF
ncbi:pyridoxamine 5'-phosphate oxidase [Prauserella sp. PE36]|uniref:Pyridoxamine 5'-phosphate oxidase family protein n=1 Tax=Prauserella endophytica TaxID=1592324 RepID=A0ABY2S676_9PSEU|nr:MULTISPECIES: pyridoxamine 5'-phosphate oxidase family protein [Prauserella]PXY21630.1 pyridoxamine 5'-phosphate oxidase [Prauserella coralliicola]RBM20006.1 pyridoxamine 5'-phosphate oxidase [Prauserella sp. PE36]TKG71413.1 pyridoxamine 5'-phosphate oxidase family protein [Prauserella endophytica]